MPSWAAISGWLWPETRSVSAARWRGERLEARADFEPTVVRLGRVGQRVAEGAEPAVVTREADGLAARDDAQPAHRVGALGLAGHELQPGVSARVFDELRDGVATDKRSRAG
jgi:hypothetical protein